MNKLDKIINECINKFLLKEGLPVWKKSGSPFSIGEQIDVSNWYKIGIVNYSPVANDTTMDIWSNPENSREYTFVSSKNNGIGRCRGDGGDLPSFALSRIEIFDEFRDTEYSIPFLGELKTEEDKLNHEDFMSHLSIKNGQVVIRHNSNVKIEDGVIAYGKHSANGYSNNSDIGWYGWASETIGKDPSNSGRYSYYCLVDINDVYDFENNLKRYTTNRQAAYKENYVAQYWDDEKHIVTVSFKSTPIAYIRDNTNGMIYDSNWKELTTF